MEKICVQKRVENLLENGGIKKFYKRKDLKMQYSF